MLPENAISKFSLKEVKKLEFSRVERLQALGRLALQHLLDILSCSIRMDPGHGTRTTYFDHSFSWRCDHGKSGNSSNIIPTAGRGKSLPQPD
jgi:hypothetical protein